MKYGMQFFVLEAFLSKSTIEIKQADVGQIITWFFDISKCRMPLYECTYFGRSVVLSILFDAWLAVSFCLEDLLAGLHISQEKFMYFASNSFSHQGFCIDYSQLFLMKLLFVLHPFVHDAMF